MKIVNLIIGFLLSLNLSAQTLFQTKVFQPEDDADELVSRSTGLTTPDFDQLAFGHHSNGFAAIGLRFQNIDIPKNAVIDSAFVQLSSAENSLFDYTAKISSELSGNSLPFRLSLNNIKQREKSLGFIDWEIKGNWFINDRNNLQRTPDISLLIEEVFSSPDWEQKNPLTFFVSGENALNPLEQQTSVISFDAGIEEHFPELFIYYSIPVSATNRIEKKSLRIFPNPVEDRLFIDKGIEKITSMKVYDSIGKLQLTKDFEILDFIDTSKLLPGIYFIEMQTATGEKIVTNFMKKG